MQGQVVFPDGAPAKELSGYFIMFQSLEHKASSTGTIQPDGSFTLGTFKDGDGALLGKQRVAITTPLTIIDQPRPTSLILPKYADFETSGLEVEIKPDAKPITVTVERAAR